MKLSTTPKDFEYISKQVDTVFTEISDEIFIDNIVSLFSSVDYNEIDEKIYSENRVRNIEKKYVNVCTRPFYSIIVCANGDITSCCDPMQRVVLGNINDDIYDVWNSNKRKKFLKMLMQKERKNHPICSSCDFPNYVLTEEDNVMSTLKIYY